MDIGHDPGVQLGEGYEGQLYQALEGFRGLVTEPCEIQLSKHHELQHLNLRQHGKEYIETNIRCQTESNQNEACTGFQTSNR